MEQRMTRASQSGQVPDLGFWSLSDFHHHLHQQTGKDPPRPNNNGLDSGFDLVNICLGLNLIQKLNVWYVLRGLIIHLNTRTFSNIFLEITTSSSVMSSSLPTFLPTSDIGEINFAQILRLTSAHQWQPLLE